MSLNKKNLAGLIIVAIFIAAFFVYVDFFGSSTSIPGTLGTSTATSTIDFATTTPSIFPNTPTSSTFTLKLNQNIKMLNTTIMPWAVLEDSRCATGVQCIQAGRVVAGVSIKSPTRDLSLEMKPGDKVYADGFNLTLLDVSPYPIAGAKTTDDQYRFVFKVDILPEAISKPSSSPRISPRCYVGGCSGQVCSSNPNAISTCEYKEEYKCFAYAKCEKQTNGQCGWTSTPEQKQCLANINSTI